MRLKSGLAAFFLAVFLMGMGSCDARDASITIDNDSPFYVDEVNVAPIDTVSWGENLLRGVALAPGDAITVVVTCDFYDVRLIDEHGHECIITDVDLCANGVTLFAFDDCGF